MKKHTDDLADIMKHHEEEKSKLNHQLEDAKGDYLKEIEKVYELIC